MRNKNKTADANSSSVFYLQWKPSNAAYQHNDILSKLLTFLSHYIDYSLDLFQLAFIYSVNYNNFKY